jgi:hypothetical protein
VPVPEPVSLMEFLQELVSDPGTRAGFLADPHGTLAGHGLAHLSPADVHDALVLVEDTRTTDFDPYGGLATGFGPPPMPAEGDHADAVQYLSGYLADSSAPATGSDPFADPGFGEDVDADLLSPWADQDTDQNDAMSFGSGDTTGGYADPGGFGTPAPAADEDLFGRGTDVDAHLDAGTDSTGDGTGDGTGMDDGFHAAGSPDPYPDTHPHDPGAPASDLPDVDF